MSNILFTRDGLVPEVPFDPLEDKIIIGFAKDVSDAVHGVEEYHAYMQAGSSPLEAFGKVAESYRRVPLLPLGYTVREGEVVKKPED